MPNSMETKLCNPLKPNEYMTSQYSKQKDGPLKI
ncbi:hypothetical protein SOVF_021570 [Spinacia oleracea]|nr:hypothetical protein SOVF_021570 [Spinacia oleracea]